MRNFSIPELLRVPLEELCLNILVSTNALQISITGLRSAVSNVSGTRCVSDCRSRGPEFDPGPVPYFRGD